jgi:hypothetical protein
MATCLKAREKLAPVALSFRIRFSGGYANIAGSSGSSLAFGMDLGIPLNRQQDWMLFIGANAAMLAQREGDFRTAFLVGGRLGLEKQWSPSTGGPILGVFLGGGATFVSDRAGTGATTSYLPGGYGEAGLTGGYKFSPSIGNLSIQAEAGFGSTTKIELHDRITGQANPQTLQVIQAGLKATLMF